MLHAAKQIVRSGVAMAMLVVAGTTAMRAQEQAGGGRGQFAGMQRAQGEVTAVAGSTLTLRDADGNITQVVTTTNTRMMTGKMVPVKIADIKVGDGAMAMGQLDAPNKTLHAAMVFTTDAATLKAMKENLGKTYIAGRVMAVDLDNATLTVERPDKVSQTIGLDESTSFRRGRLGRGGMGGDAAPVEASAESLTLADIKVGDQIGGQGSLKKGVFVPTQVTVAPPRGMHGKPERPVDPAK